MQDYQGNAKKDKEKPAKTEKPKTEKVVTGEVFVRPPSVASKFKRIFFGGDMNTAAQYVARDVLLPALRNLLVDVISKGADRLIYGESSRRPSPPSYAPRIQYNNPIYRHQPNVHVPSQRPIDRWSRGGERRVVDNIVVSSKADADAVIEQLINIFDSYDMVSLADLYETLGMPTSHVDHKWGWTNLSNIESRQVRDGYHISLPPLEELS